MKTLPTSLAEILVLSCLSEGEKSLFEVFKLSRLSHDTTRRVLLRLTRDGFVERRWEKAPTKNIPKYLYKRNPGSPSGADIPGLLSKNTDDRTSDGLQSGVSG
jgi:hypothetical protein